MGHELRQLREEDADAVVGLFRAAFGDERPIDAAEVASWRRNQELKPEWLRVLEVDSRVVGYGDIWIQNDDVALEVAAPGHWETFLEWAEQRAQADRLSRVRLFFPSGHELAAIVTARGYRHTLSAYTMQVDLDERPPQPPAPPAGIELRAHRPGDEEAVRVTLNECFASDPFHYPATTESFREFFLEKPGFDPALWRLAWDGDELAGIALGYPHSPGEPDLGWISTLGVRAPWRRRGLGDALLRATFGALHDAGLRRVGLGVNAENETGALRLYQRAGMRVVRQGDTWELDTAR